MNNIQIFGLGQSKSFAEQVCSQLGIRRTNHKEELHDDGEPYLLSDENVRGCDVFIIESLYSSCGTKQTPPETVCDKFLKLALFAGSIRDASAKRITLVVPYFAFQRQDRKTESRAGVYTKYVPQMLEGILRSNDRILTMDTHNLSAFQSGFRMMLDHLEARPIITDWISRNITSWDVDLNRLVVVSPDEGGAKRSGKDRSKLQETLGVDIGGAIVYKTHEGKNINAHGIMGEVKNKHCLIFDDMISSCRTNLVCVEQIESAGGKVAGIFATHGLFVGPNANKNVRTLLEKNVKIVVTDTVKPKDLSPELEANIEFVPTAPMFAEAIRRIHNEESISNLLR
jgi:ribose-phosphate pyrophosphokinase